MRLLTWHVACLISTVGGYEVVEIGAAVQRSVRQAGCECDEQKRSEAGGQQHRERRWPPEVATREAWARVGSHRWQSARGDVIPWA